MLTTCTSLEGTINSGFWPYEHLFFRLINIKNVVLFVPPHPSQLPLPKILGEIKRYL
jgi:hypothetical protein